jgi:hypothetical protein
MAEADVRRRLFSFFQIGARDSSRINERMNQPLKNIRDASANRTLKRTEVRAPESFQFPLLVPVPIC